jgi:hypothetical protein
MISGLDTVEWPEIAPLHQDLGEMRTAIVATIEQATAEVVRWIVVMGIAQVAMIVALTRLIPGLYR